MRIINIQNLNFSHTGKEIFRNAALTVDSGDHIALVGPNGSGKSTLIKILMGTHQADGEGSHSRRVREWGSDGEITTLSGLRVAYMDQYSTLHSSDATVWEYLNGVFAPLLARYEDAMKIYAEAADDPAECDSPESQKRLERAERILEECEERGYYEIEKRITAVLNGLGFEREKWTSSTSILSGGQKTKLILGGILLRESDLLILDEPTNFLDIAYTDWLADYLAAFRGAFLVVSHDKAFLRKIAKTVVEINHHELIRYDGGYDYFEREKQKRDEAQEKQAISQEKFVVKAQQYIDSFIDSPIISSKATWLKKMLKNLEEIERPDIVLQPEFAFSYKSGTNVGRTNAAGDIITLRNAEIGYDGRAILPPFSLSVRSKEKIVFVGYNGVGKTTLMRSIAGELPLVGGELELGDNLLHYFVKQEEDYEVETIAGDRQRPKYMRHERIVHGVPRVRDDELTAFEYAGALLPEVPTESLQRKLLVVGLTRENIFGRLRSLSGGELVRLHLCVTMQKPVNLLILDEPTNHLDVYSKDVLIHAIAEFPGAVIMTSHDTNIDLSFATRVVRLEK